nr:agropine synthesis reductase [Ipomoea batatas]
MQTANAKLLSPAMFSASFPSAASCVRRFYAQSRRLSSPILDARASFEIDENLKERGFGEHEGGYGPLKMFEDNYPDCEDTQVFSLRVARALNHAKSENTLFVSHGGVLRVIAALLQVSLSKEHTDNGRVLHFKRGVSNWTVEIHQSPVILVSGPIRKAITEKGGRAIENKGHAKHNQERASIQPEIDGVEHSSRHGMPKFISYMARILGAITDTINDVQARSSSCPLSTPRDTINDTRRRQRREVTAWVSRFLERHAEPFMKFYEQHQESILVREEDYPEMQRYIFAQNSHPKEIWPREGIQPDVRQCYDIYYEMIKSASNQYYYELSQAQKQDIWLQDPWNFDDIDSVLEEVEKIERAYA